MYEPHPSLSSQTPHSPTQSIKPSILTFHIYHDHHKINTLKIQSTNTVFDLMQALKYNLSQHQFPVSNILCLQTLDNQEGIDYSLLINNFELSNYWNNLALNLVVRQNVHMPQNISLCDFTLKKCLEKGIFSDVWLVRHIYDGKMYVLKQISKTYFTEFKKMEQILRQKKIMTESLDDFPFAAKLVASFQSEDALNFLLEFYPGGQMFFHLQNRKFEQSQAKIYFAELITIFEFLHSRSIIYRDLKPENIMIDFNGRTKLTDFGLCQINYDKQDRITSYCGSLEYMTPEIKNNTGYSYSVDFYTLGAFLYEMVMGIPPYYQNQPLTFNHIASSEFKILVKGLIAYEVQNRIGSFQQIKKSKFMSDINFQDILRCKHEAPLKISINKSYIHEELRDLKRSFEEEGKFDRLFDFFNYLDGSYEELKRCYSGIKTLYTTSLSCKNTMKMRTEGLIKIKTQNKRSKNCTRKSNRSSSSKKNSSIIKKNIYLQKADKDPKGFSLKKTKKLSGQKTQRCAPSRI